MAMGFYTDGSGAPDELIISTGTTIVLTDVERDDVTGSSYKLFRIPLTADTKLAPNDYWVACYVYTDYASWGDADFEPLAVLNAAPADTEYSYSVPSEITEMPDPFPSGSSDDDAYRIYASYKKKALQPWLKEAV